MTPVFATVLTLFLILYDYSITYPEERAAGVSMPPVLQGQVEGTVIHVDKYAVYIPNYVFYWDDRMSKKDIDSLTKAAEKLRNKKAIITYSSTGDLAVDRRPLLVDIMPSDEHTKNLTLWSSSGMEPEFSSQEDQSNASQLDEELEDEGEEEDYVLYSSTPGPRHLDSSFFDEEEEVTPITREEVVRLINTCMTALSRKDLDTLLSCYGKRVEYFNSGLVDRNYLRDDKELYFSNWDKIETHLAGDVVLIVTDQQDIRIAKFESAFSLANRNRSITGRAENIWKVKKVNGRLRIVGERQKILVRQ